MSKIQKYTEIKNNEQPQKEESSILALETLSKEYDVVLAKYIQLQTDYITSLNEHEKLPKKMITNQGTAFWGMSAIRENKVSNVNDCVALCSSNPKCSGATFNSVEQICRLRKGTGSLVAASKNEISIIPENTLKLFDLKKTNERLIQINNEITKLISTNMPLYNENKKEMGIQNDALKKNYYKLTADKLKIEQKIKENESLQREQENNALVLNSHYSNYTLYFFIVVALILFLSMVMMFSNNATNTSTSTMMPIYNAPMDSYASSSSSPFGNLFTIFILVCVFVLIYYFYKKAM